MDYGVPEPDGAFAIGHPNGAAYSYQMLQAGVRCDVPALTNRHGKASPPPGLGPFVIAYFEMATRFEKRFGFFPYHIYPHHFYEPWAPMEPFSVLDKSRIVAFIYRRESVCLSLKDGRLSRRLISTGEMRIDLPHR